MPTRLLLRAGIVALLTGILLYWGCPVWLNFVELYPGSQEQLASVLFWFSVSLAGAGVLLLCRAALRLFPLRSESPHSPRMVPAMALRNVLPLPRYRQTSLIVQLPNFGLIYGAVLWILIFLFMIVDAPRQYYGLLIDFKTHDSVVWERSPWRETLSVYVAAGDRYYINGQPVPREALRARLQEELDRRMVWMVYFEADYDTLNMNAIFAMDTIQGLGAKLVWITPRVREELQQRNVPAP